MTLAKIFIICLAVLAHVASSSILEDSGLTVEKANEYIAENKDFVNQTYRLRYHFMAPIGWINYPSGFIQYRGEYHLFYQYNPYGLTSNEVHWGHAKSKDLILWEDLPVALAPDQSYDDGGVYSGSVIEKDGKLYAMYSGNSANGYVQCIAVSEDGITFEKVPENPVLKASDLPSNAQPLEFRDPKVFQRDDVYYAVTVSKTINNTGQVLLYQSSDLINWTFKSILLQGNEEQGNMWETPDLFELDGKDVLIVSAIHMPPVGDDFQNINSVIAFVGLVDWDEGTFQVETVKELDHGLDTYATQTLLDDQGQRVAISWMNMLERNYPTADLNQGWVGAMTLPRVLHIKDNYVVQNPVHEVSSLGKYLSYEYMSIYGNMYSIKDETRSMFGINGKVVAMELILDLAEAELFSIEVRKAAYESTVVSYDTATQKLSLNRTNSGVDITGHENSPIRARHVKVPLEDNKLSLQIFLDVSSIEVFVNSGAEVLTANIYPRETISEDMASEDIQVTAQGTVLIDDMTFIKIRTK